MPHFVIDCSENILKLKSPEEIMQPVYDIAESSGLFGKGDVKVRINPFEHYKLDKSKASFIHIFAYVLEGRTVSQRAELSKNIIRKLNSLFPNVPIISINISEFETATYCNKSMI